MTVQGMRTGISGGAAPQGGHALNLNNMTQILALRHDGYFLLNPANIFDAP